MEKEKNRLTEQCSARRFLYGAIKTAARTAGKWIGAAGGTGEGCGSLQGDLLADLQGLEKVVPDRKDGGVAAEPDAVFKLEIETPVVQVAAAHRGVEIICHHGLAVDKTGGKFIDAAPASNSTG